MVHKWNTSNEWKPVAIRLSQRKIRWLGWNVWIIMRMDITQKNYFNSVQCRHSKQLAYYFSLAVLKLTSFLHKIPTRNTDFLWNPKLQLGDLIKQTIQRAALLLFHAWYWQMLTLPARLLFCTLLKGQGPFFFLLVVQENIDGHPRPISLILNFFFF